MSHKYLPNAFWEKDDKSQVKCIRITDLGGGKERKDVLSYKNTDSEFQNVLDAIGVDQIDRYSKERWEQKKREKQNHSVREEQKQKSNELEMLFAKKLKAFEIEAIKTTTNKDLRTRLRRATNEIELNALSALIIGESLGLFGTKSTD